MYKIFDITKEKWKKSGVKIIVLNGIKWYMKNMQKKGQIMQIYRLLQENSLQNKENIDTNQLMNPKNSQTELFTQRLNNKNNSGLQKTRILQI